MYSGGSRKIRGGSKGEKGKQQGMWGAVAEGYFQFNTALMPGFCMFKKII